MDFGKVKNWLKIHKGVIGVIVGMVILYLILAGVFGLKERKLKYPYVGAPRVEKALPGIHLEKGIEKVPLGEAPEVEVKEGSMEIKSKEAETDFEKLKSLTENQKGYVERSTKSITSLYVLIEATLRVPPENFLALIEKLKGEFEVKSYNIKNYRISIEKEMDELEILRKSLKDYEKIREEIGKMAVGKEKIELLMKLTDKELELKKKERMFKRELSAKEKRGEYATLYVTLKQQKSPKVWPENVLNKFKERIKRAFEKVTNTLIELVGGGIELFFRAIQIVVYLFILGIIFGGAFKVFQILYRKWWKR